MRIWTRLLRGVGYLDIPYGVGYLDYMFTIVQLSTARFGVYASGRRGPFGTPLMFAGSLDECLAYRRTA